MKVQRLKDGRLRDAGTGKILKDAKEYYNWPRVEATLKSETNGKTYKQEINFPTRPYSSEVSAKKATEQDIRRWINERGNRKYNDTLKLVSFRKK